MRIKDIINEYFETRVKEYESQINDIYDLVLFGAIYDITKNTAARAAYKNKVKEFYEERNQK